jgi:hypothetical protein
MSSFLFFNFKPMNIVMIKITKTIMFIVVVTTIFFGCFAGCAPRGISVVSVTGTVTYNGQPVENALISFVPQSPETRGASAITDRRGEFSLLTQGATGSGAMPGEYKVLVSKLVEVDESGKEVVRKPAEKFDPNNPSPQEIMYPQKNLLPEKYNREETTDLTANITKGKNRVLLNLED